MEINEWDRVATNNGFAPPDGAPENMNYSAVNNTMREAMAVHKRHWEDTNGGLVAGGTAAAYQLTTRGTYTTPFPAGLNFAFRAAVACTAGATLQINALAVANMRKPDPTGATVGIPLAAGDIVADGVYLVVWDSANSHFLVLNPEDVSRDSLRLTSTVDHTLVSTTHALQIGADAVANLCADDNGLQARDNGAAVLLELQRSGGNVGIGPGTGLNVVHTPTGAQALNNGAASAMALQTSGGALTTGGAFTATGALAGASAAIVGALTGASISVTGAVSAASMTLTGALAGGGTMGLRLRPAIGNPVLGTGDHGTLSSPDDVNAVLLATATTTDFALPAASEGTWVFVHADGNGSAITVGTDTSTLVGSTNIADDSAALFICGSSNVWFRIY